MAACASAMIRTLATPIEERYRLPPARTTGRYEGLVNFAYKLSGLFGSSLRAWSVLDVGGGDGWLGEMLVCSRYYWVDPHGGDAVGLAEALPWATGGVDLVVSKQTLPHFTDPILACHEMLRVARYAVVIRQDWGYRDAQGNGYEPIGWPGHSRSQIDHPNDILGAMAQCGASPATYDGEDFVARRIR